MIRRIAGMIVNPRATLVLVVRERAWLATWSAILVVWACLGAALLSTDVGQQALVDERVRVVETLGGTISDAEYLALQANPPWWVYLTSGSRALLTPVVTLLVAVAILAVTRLDGANASFSQALAVAVHASVVLLLEQLVATPLHYLRESLTVPLNLAAVLPLMEEGTWPARFFGTMDVFALWWAGLLASGLAVLTGRKVGRYVLPLVALFVAFAAVVAVVITAMGGV